MRPLKVALFSLPVPYLPHSLELSLFGDLRLVLVLCGLCDLGAEASLRIPAGTAPALPGALQGAQGLRLPSESLLEQLLPFQEPCRELMGCLVGWAAVLKTRHCWVCQQLLLLSLMSVGAVLLCVTTAFPSGIGNIAVHSKPVLKLVF